jgi:hypothetical protein
MRTKGEQVMPSKTSLSVQKHRAKLAAEKCKRMEVTLQRDLIEQAHELARQKRRPLWELVEVALIAYLKIEDAGETGNENNAKGIG